MSASWPIRRQADLAMRATLGRLRAGRRLARRGDPADHPDAADRAALLAGEMRGVAAERQAQGQVTVGAESFDVEPSQAGGQGAALPSHSVRKTSLPR